MPSDEIKIKVESNILNDADKIKTAHSYNIALPRTLTNDAIFYDAFVPSADTGGKSTHTYLTASLNVDDVPLFTNGQAVLTSVDDKGYNLTLLWGILGIFDEIKREGLSLNELPLSQYWSETYEDWQVLNRNNAPWFEWVSGMNNDIYNTLTSESKDEVDKLPWDLPIAYPSDILQKIGQVYGLTFDLSNETQTRLAKLIHPLTSLNSMCKDEPMTITAKCGCTLYNGNLYFTLAPVVRDGAGNMEFGTSVFSNWSATNEMIANNVLWAVNTNDGKILAKNEISFKKITVQGTCDWAFRATLNAGGDSEEQETSTSHGARYRMDKTWGNVRIPYGEEILRIDSPTHGDSSTPCPTNDVRITLEVEAIEGMHTPYTIPFYGTPYINHYPIVRNYPDMGVVKYLSNLLAQIGGVVVSSITGQNTLHIITIDEIMGETPANLETLGVKTITMSLDDLAQKNIYKHKDNEDNGINYTGEGVIYTNDSTLELEREAFSSDFKVPYNTLIRLFEVEDDKAKWVGNGDYICGWEQISLSSAVLRNTGQGFAETIADYYTNYEKIVARPKVIEIAVRLSILELMAIDFTAPVHINQLNRDYLIVSVESDTGDNYKLKLIQI